MPSRFCLLLRCCSCQSLHAEWPVNSLLSSYEAFPGGSNPQRKECKAAINHNTPFCRYFRCRATPSWLLNKLLFSWHAYMRDEPRVSSMVVLVVAPALTQTQAAVDRSANLVGIQIILPIVLPPAHLAQLQRIGRRKCPISTTEATGRGCCAHAISMRWLEAFVGVRQVRSHYCGNGPCYLRR